MTDHNLPTAKPYVQSLHSYVPGRPIADVMREFGLTSVAKIASNESPMGAAPSAKAAAASALADAHM